MSGEYEGVQYLVTLGEGVRVDRGKGAVGFRSRVILASGMYLTLLRFIMNVITAPEQGIAFAPLLRHSN